VNTELCAHKYSLPRNYKLFGQAGQSLTITDNFLSPIQFSPRYSSPSLDFRYADRAKKIKNKPKVNEDPKVLPFRAQKPSHVFAVDRMSTSERGYMPYFCSGV
jgi:hypothetical protein